MSFNHICRSFTMHKAEGSRSYFNRNCASEWNFFAYISAARNDIKKFKYNNSKSNFLEDLDWVINSKPPKEVKELALRLKNSIPSRALVKAKQAKRAPKNCVNNQGIIVYGDVNDSSLQVELRDNPSSSIAGDKVSTKRQLIEDGEESKEERAKKKGKMREEVVGGRREEENSIWSDWIAFMENEENIKDFHPYSPEYHGVIRAGQGVSWRPHLDEETYMKHLKEKKAEEFPLPATTVTYMNSVIDSVDLKEYKRNTKKTPDEDEDVFDFLEAIFRTYFVIYTSTQDLEESEASFNDFFVFPFLKAVVRAFGGEERCGADFKVGETFLKAMTKQLNDQDEAYQYKADGLICLYQMKELEVLILETSSNFGSTDKPKSSFDHHKGLFGGLSMLKTIADEFCFASVDQFSKLKVLFVHASGKSLYLWSLRFVKEGPAYELWLEGSLEFNPNFDDKLEQLPKALNFFWMMKCLLQQTVKNMKILQEEHRDFLKKK